MNSKQAIEAGLLGALGGLAGVSFAQTGLFKKKVNIEHLEVHIHVEVNKDD